jgi:flagellar protein FlaF
MTRPEGALIVTSHTLARNAYAAAATPVGTPRGTEYALFERITARLARATAADAPMAQRAEALHDNRRLWTTIATDIATPDNALPEGLRAQLFYLAEFSLLQSRAALRDPAALSALVAINRSVMRGLNGQADAT